MKYIQFPWRFLGGALFSLALASGFIIGEFEKFKLPLTICIILATIFLNFNFFRPDIWYTIGDKDLESGSRWIESTFSSLPDYWPVYGQLPNKSTFTITYNLGLITKRSNFQYFKLKNFI